MTPETILEHDGIQQPIIEWALDYGITPTIIIGRLGRGMSIEAAITTPMKTGYHGQRLPIFSQQQKMQHRCIPSHGKTPRNSEGHNRRAKEAACAPPSSSRPQKKSSTGKD